MSPHLEFPQAAATEGRGWRRSGGLGRVAGRLMKDCEGLCVGSDVRIDGIGEGSGKGEGMRGISRMGKASG